MLNTMPNLSSPQAYPAPQHPVHLAYPAPQHFVQQQQPAYPAAQHPVQPQQPSPYSNGLSSNTVATYDQSSNPASSWNSQFAQGMVPPQQAPNYGTDTIFYCDRSNIFGCIILLFPKHYMEDVVDTEIVCHPGGCMPYMMPSPPVRCVNKSTHTHGPHHELSLSLPPSGGTKSTLLYIDDSMMLLIIFLFFLKNTLIKCQFFYCFTSICHLILTFF
jgi:hypothetical protein